MIAGFGDAIADAPMATFAPKCRGGLDSSGELASHSPRTPSISAVTPHLGWQVPRRSGRGIRAVGRWAVQPLLNTSIPRTSHGHSHVYGAALVNPAVDLWGVHFPVLNGEEEPLTRLVLQCGTSAT